MDEAAGVALGRALEERDLDAALALVRSGRVTADEAFAAALDDVLGTWIELVQELILAGADRNQALGEFGESALMLAAIRGDKRLYRLLRKAKASVSARDYDGFTVAHHAVRGGRLYLLADLLACGLDPNATSDDGQTPLSAAMYHDPEDTRAGAEAKARKMLEVLVSHGARPDPRALRDAEELGFVGVAARLRQLAAEQRKVARRKGTRRGRG